MKKLLLHICCAPDEAWVVKNLKQEYLLYCFFCNPNITPKNEYMKRLHEAEKVAQMFDVPFMSDSYNPNSWESTVLPYADTPEGGIRCQHCFDLRLEATAKFCREINFPMFTTVMSISPHKRIEMLNSAGNKAAKRNSVLYAEFNFKKKNGFLESIELSRELNLYRQDYCGCRLSLAERNKRNKDKIRQD